MSVSAGEGARDGATRGEGGVGGVQTPGVQHSHHPRTSFGFIRF